MDSCMLYVDNVLTPELIQYAKENLNETPEVRKQALEALRKLVDEDEEIEYMDDETIFLLTLRIRKFDVQKALNHYHKCYQNLQSNHRVFFSNNFDGVRKFLKADIFGFLKYRDPMGRAIIYAFPGKWNIEELPTPDVVFGGLVTVMSSIYNPVNQVAGYVTIIDFENLQMKHVLSLLRWFVLGVFSVQKICPGFMKGLHLVYTSSLYKIVWNAIQPVLSKKLKKRIMFHNKSDLSELHVHIPPELLPLDLGGSLPFSNDHWTQDFEGLVKQYTDLITKNGYKTNK